MTNREFYAAIVSNVTLSNEIRAHAQAELEKMDHALELRKENLTKKKQTPENADLVEKLTKMLQTRIMTAAEIGIALDISTQKATPLAKSIPNVVIGEKGNGSRKVKTYTINA